MSPQKQTAADALLVLDDLTRAHPDLVASHWYLDASKNQLVLFDREWKWWVWQVRQTVRIVGARNEAQMDTEAKLRDLEMAAKSAIDVRAAEHITCAKGAIHLIMIERGYQSTDEIDTGALPEDDHLRIWLDEWAEWTDLASKAYSVIHSAFKDERAAQAS